MNDLTVFQKDGIEVVDSREVAEVTGKQHAHLMRDIKMYSGILSNSNESKFGAVDFFIPSTYTDSKGETRPCYLLTKKGCDMVANKMTGEKGVLFTAMYVTAFEKMRNQLSKPMTQNELIAAMAQANVEQERKILALEERADRNEEMLTELANVFDVPTCPDRGQWQEEMNCRIKSICQTYELNYQSFRKRLYERLELQLGVDLEARQRNLKKRLKESGAKYDEVQKVSKLHVISRDASLRAAFELIVRSEAARCLAGKEARHE